MSYLRKPNVPKSAPSAAPPIPVARPTPICAPNREVPDGRGCPASYGQTISWVANQMALCEPDNRVVLLISWLFDAPVGVVKHNLRKAWTDQRRGEQNDRDPTGGKVHKRR